jgi:hypothetical protein
VFVVLFAGAWVAQALFPAEFTGAAETAGSLVAHLVDALMGATLFVLKWAFIGLIVLSVVVAVGGDRFGFLREAGCTRWLVKFAVGIMAVIVFLSLCRGLG